MRKKWKRILAAVLAAGMLFSDSAIVSATETQPVAEVMEAEDDTEIIVEPEDEIEVLTVEEVNESVESNEATEEIVEEVSAQEDVEEILVYESVAEVTEVTTTDIPDSVLWAEICKAVGVDSETTTSLTTNQLAEVTTLIHYGSLGDKITDLTGIGYLTNLKKIYVWDALIVDASPLTACINLEDIDIRRCDVTTLPDFSGLTKLTNLYVSNCNIPNSEISEEKYPAGITTNLTGQNPKLEFVVDDVVCREAADKQTYYLQAQVRNIEDYSRLNIQIDDITDEKNVTTVYTNASASYSKKTDLTYDNYNGKAYQLDFELSGLTLTPGIRIWRFTFNDGNRPYIAETEVIVDNKREGITWEIPDEKVPAEVKNYILTNYSEYDTEPKDEPDGKLSYKEFAAISEFSTSESTQFTDFSFLQYMTDLKTLLIGYQTAFTNEELSKISNYENVKNITTLSLSGMPAITSLEPVAANLTKVQYMTLWAMTGITDVSPLQSVSKLSSLSLNSMNGLTGLATLKVLPLNWLFFDNGAFSDTDIFQFICNKMEVSVQAGTSVSLVSDMVEESFCLKMQDISSVTVTMGDDSIAGVAEADPFTLYGFKEGTTTATISYGENSYVVNVTVTAASFNYDPAVGEAVAEEDRMTFAGTTGLTSARVSRTLIDSSDNIWNITSRKPEVILESNDYVKYAGRILYQRQERFGVETVEARGEIAMYLDDNDTLWRYEYNEHSGDNNYAIRYEVMRNVEDWREGGYSQATRYSIYNDFFLILKQDGSLWGISFKNTDSYSTEISLGQLIKIEDSGVKEIYPNAYLTNNGEFYRVWINSSKISKYLIADDIEQVWENGSTAIAKDSSGTYYTTYRKVNSLNGTVESFVQGSYYDPAWAEFDAYGNFIDDTNYDMMPGFLLMDNGKLYRTYQSNNIMYAQLNEFDTGVTSIEKDYYWKENVAYAYSGETYEDFIGNGAGKGLYPKEATDGTQTLYVNGVPYLTKVVDWVKSDDCIYAIRVDNTLWQFDETTVPTKVDLSTLNNTPITATVVDKEINITDLENGVESITVDWVEVEDAVSYKAYLGTSSTSSSWTEYSVETNSYTFTGLSSNTKYYFQLKAFDTTGTEIGSSWSYYTYTVSPTLTISNVAVDLSEETATATIKAIVAPSDYTGDCKLRVKIDYCADESSETGETTELFKWDKYYSCTGGGTYELPVTGIPKDIDYIYTYIYLYKDDNQVTSSSFNFDTNEHQYLTATDIPDEALRAILAERSTDLDLYELNKYESLTIDNNNVKDLTGLHLLTNLESITLENLDSNTVDVSKLPSGIVDLYINRCGLTVIPNCSRFEQLSTLDLRYNKIPESEFVSSNLALATFVRNYNKSHGLDVWMSEQAAEQYGEPQVTISEKYYQTAEGTYPFIMLVERIDSAHDYSLTIHEGDEEVLSTSEYSGTQYGIQFEVFDTGLEKAGVRELKIVVLDKTENKEIYNESKTITFITAGEVQVEKQYLPTSFEWWSCDKVELLTNEQYNDLVETGIEEDRVLSTKGAIKDKKGGCVPVTVNIRKSSSIPAEYREFYASDEKYALTKYYASIASEYKEKEYVLSEGTGLLEIYGKDGNTVAVTLTDFIEVTSKPIIEQVYVDEQNYDVQGEYIYLEIQGFQMDGKQPNFIITDKNGNNVSSEAYEWTYGYQPICKIHLDEEYRNINSYYYRITDKDYYGDTTGAIYISELRYPYGVFGNTLTNEIIGYISSGMDDGTEMMLDIMYDDEVCKTVNVVAKNGEFRIPFTPDSGRELGDYRTHFYVLDDHHDSHWYFDVNTSEQYSNGSTSITTKANDKNVRYFSQIQNASTDAVINVLDPKDYSLIASFEMPENSTDFSDMPLADAGLVAGEVYLVQVIDTNGYAAMKGLFDIVTATGDLEFFLTNPSGEAVPKAAENEYRIDYSSAIRNKVFYLEADTVGNKDAKITVKSSNSSVVAATLVKNTHKVKLTVKAAGTANITVTASDNKYTETVKIDLRDYTPRMSSTSVPMNRALTRTSEATLYSVYGTEVTKVDINENLLTSKEKKADYVDYFEVELTEKGFKVVLLDDSGRLNAKGKVTLLGKGTYRLPITVTTTESEELSASGEIVIREIPMVVSVKMTNTKPKVTAKQTEKINFFYTDTKAVFTLKPNTGTIENVSVEENGDTVYFDKVYDETTGVLTLIPKAELRTLTKKNLNKALNLKLVTKVGESTLTQTLTIKTDSAKPSISLNKTASTVYKVTEKNDDGTKSYKYLGKVITFTPINKKSKKALENIEEVKLIEYSTTKQGVTTQHFSPDLDMTALKDADGSYTLSANVDGSYTMYFVGSATATAKISVKGANWSNALTTSYKVSVSTKTISGKLSTSKMTLNAYYPADQKTVSVSASLPYDKFELLTEETTVKTPKKSNYTKGDIQVIKTADNAITVKLKAKGAGEAPLSAGTYTISLPVKYTFTELTEYTPKYLSLKLTVIQKAASVSWKNSGKLNTVDRNESGIIATPKVANLNATLKKIEFSSSDLEAKLNEKISMDVVDGNAIIKLLSGAAVSTKEKYKINPLVTLTTESGQDYRIYGKTITVQPTQSSMKMTLAPKQSTMYQYSSGTHEEVYTYTLKGAVSAQVKDVVLTNMTSNFEVVHDAAAKTIRVVMTNNNIAAKTHTLKFKVYFVDQATNKETPINVSTKVVVKK